MEEGRSRLAVVGHPVVVGALAVLVVNDRLLKDWSGGIDDGLGGAARTVTGKASDIAGVLLLAVLVGALTGRRRATVVAVGVAFAALKLSPAVADLAVPVLGGRTRTDPWDLLALAALAPADRLLRRLDLPAPDLRPAWASVRATLGLAVVVASVPAMTATSCSAPEYPGGLDTLVVRADGTLAAATTYAGRRPDVDAGTGDRLDQARRDARLRWYVSADDGRTWRRGEIGADEAAALLDRPRATEACAGETCWTVVSPTEVLETSPGGRHRIATLSDDQLEAVDANEVRGGCDATFHVLGTEIVAVDGGAVATAGEYGVTRLEPGGEWEPVAVDRMELPDDLPAARSRYLRHTPAVGVIVLVLAGVATSLWRPTRRAAGWMSVGIAVVAFVPARMLVQFADGNGQTPRESDMLLFSTTATVVGLALLPLVVAWVWPMRTDDRSGRA
ncbi:MAG TPA: hypothetical protein VF228_12205 [Iamia sp.]